MCQGRWRRNAAQTLPRGLKANDEQQTLGDPRDNPSLDDLRDVSPPAKVAGQVLAGGVLYLLGVTMYYFRVPFADFIALIVTLLWIIVASVMLYMAAEHPSRPPTAV